MSVAALMAKHRPYTPSARLGKGPARNHLCHFRHEVLAALPSFRGFDELVRLRFRKFTDF